MGLTFKENCRDLRNTRVIDVVNQIRIMYTNDVYDPLASPTEAYEEYDLSLVSAPSKNTYDAIIVAVVMINFEMKELQIRTYGKPRHILYDLKVFSRKMK